MCWWPRPIPVGQTARRLARSCGYGLAMAAVYGFICSALLQLGLGWLDCQCSRVEPEVIAASKPFNGLDWLAHHPGHWFYVGKELLRGAEPRWLPLAVLLASVGLNVFLNFILIYAPLRRSRGQGRGVAQGWRRSLSRVVALGALPFIIQCVRQFCARNGRAGTSRGWGANVCGVLLALGRARSAGQILFEVGVFNFATLLAGMLGKVVLDAHQITLNIAGMAYMVPLGLSQATGIRVSQAMGVGSLSEAWRIGWGSLGCAAVFMAGYAVFVLVTRQALPHIFLRADAAQAVEVMALSSTLLLWAAAFAIFDGMQIVSPAILRGMHDVRVPLALSFAGFWLVAAPLAWYWSFVRGWGGPGIWLGLFCGELAVAALLVGRFSDDGSGIMPKQKH